MRNAKDVAQFVSFAIFWIVTAVFWAGLHSVAPGLSIFWLSFLSMLGAACVTALLAWIRSRRLMAKRAKAEQSYQSDRNAEREKQIDEMRRANSRIPKVKR